MIMGAHAWKRLCMIRRSTRGWATEGEKSIPEPVVPLMLIWIGGGLGGGMGLATALGSVQIAGFVIGLVAAFLAATFIYPGVRLLRISAPVRALAALVLGGVFGFGGSYAVAHLHAAA